MKGIALLATLAFTLMALSGCSDDPVVQEDNEIPTQITQEEVDRLEELVSEEYPRVFSFPGQEYLAPVLHWVNGTVDQQSNAGLEPIDDDGPADFNGVVQATDISDMVPAGQPVELRLKLKWAGDPGASADLDLYINVPGTKTTYSEGRNDESWNWNRITKTAVVNTARIEGQPFEIGVQATNGKVIVPEGISYSIEVEAYFPENPVLPPFVPYALTLPEGGTGFILESEPVTGDEHVDTDLIIVGPDDKVLRSLHHNDIATETVRIAASMPGDYVFYVAHERGGFLRVETDVPNPTFEARALTKVEKETDIQSGAVVAPAAPGGFGDEGALDLPGTPLDIYGYIHVSQGASADGDVQLDIVSEDGLVHSLTLSGTVLSDQGRIGDPPAEKRNREFIVDGQFQYHLRANGAAGIDVGYGFIGYER